VIFGDRRVFSALRVRLADTKAPIEERRRALAVLREGHDPELAAVLVALLDDPPLLREALRGLSEHDEPAIADAVLARWAGFGPEARRDAVATLAVRPAAARALLAAIDAGAVEKTVVDAYAARQLRSLGDAAVDAWLAERWGTVRAAGAHKAAEIARWRARLTEPALAAADRPRGRAVFARTCGSCHRLFDAGETVGPDLTGSNRLDVGYVLENVIDPSAVVGRDYRLEIVKTTGGRIVSGLVTDETDTAITLRTQTEAVVVPKAEIEGRRTDPSSMMPEGLLAGLSEAEVRDLVAYLGSPVQVPLPGRAAKVDEGTGRVAGAIEGEALKVVRVGRGDVREQEMAVFGRRAWSADAQLWWTGGRPGDRLELALPVARAGRYEVDAVLTKARDYAIVRLALDERQIDAPIDLYDPRVAPTDPIRLGVFDLTAGEHRLSVEIVGANARAIRAYMFGLDFVRLHPVE